MSTSPITTHVLDTATGRPAAGVPVVLERLDAPDHWGTLGSDKTDSDGRAKTLYKEAQLTSGVYRLTFQVGEYLKRSERSGFYPYISIVFEVVDPSQHYHVPVLFSGYGYTTYRGS